MTLETLYESNLLCLSLPHCLSSGRSFAFVYSFFVPLLHTHTHTKRETHTRTHTHANAHTHTHTHTHTHKHTHTRTYAHNTHTHTRQGLAAELSDQDFEDQVAWFRRSIGIVCLR